MCAIRAFGFSNVLHRRISRPAVANGRVIRTKRPPTVLPGRDLRGPRRFYHPSGRPNRANARRPRPVGCDIVTTTVQSAERGHRSSFKKKEKERSSDGWKNNALIIDTGRCDSRWSVCMEWRDANFNGDIYRIPVTRARLILHTDIRRTTF